MSLADLIRKVHGPDKLTVALDLFIRQRPGDYREPGWHPSQFCGACPRLMTLDRLLPGPEGGGDVDVKLQRIFDVGKALHHWYQNEYFGPMGVLWGKWRSIRGEIRWGFMPSLSGEGKHHEWEFLEVPFGAALGEGFAPIRGHADGLVQLQNKWFLLEMKSINDRGFNWLGQAKTGHIAQGQIYGEMVRQKLVRECPIEIPYPESLLVLYIGKNDSQEKEFVVPLDSVAGKRELRRPLQVEEAMRDHILPDREPDCTNMLKEPAKACRMVSYCFGSLSWDELVAKGRR